MWTIASGGAIWFFLLIFLFVFVVPRAGTSPAGQRVAAMAPIHIHAVTSLSGVSTSLTNISNDGALQITTCDPAHNVYECYGIYTPTRSVLDERPPSSTRGWKGFVDAVLSCVAHYLDGVVTPPVRTILERDWLTEGQAILWDIRITTTGRQQETPYIVCTHQSSNSRKRASEIRSENVSNVLQHRLHART